MEWTGSFLFIYPSYKNNKVKKKKKIAAKSLISYTIKHNVYLIRLIDDEEWEAIYLGI